MGGTIRSWGVVLLWTVLLMGAPRAWAQDAPAAAPAAAPGAASQPDAVAAAKMAGDNAWMLTSSALVLFMTAPGLAMFYGGLVRTKNVLSVMMQCLFLMGLLTVIWGLYGYTLAFGGDDPNLGGTFNAYV